MLLLQMGLALRLRRHDLPGHNHCAQTILLCLAPLEHPPAHAPACTHCTHPLNLTTRPPALPCLQILDRTKPPVIPGLDSVLVLFRPQIIQYQSNDLSEWQSLTTLPAADVSTAQRAQRVKGACVAVQRGGVDYVLVFSAAWVLVGGSMGCVPDCWLPVRPVFAAPKPHVPALMTLRCTTALNSTRPLPPTCLLPAALQPRVWH